MSAPAYAIEEQALERQEYSALARIMTLSGLCALGSGLLSAGSVKIVAALAGPAALGLLATLQQIRDTALNAATLNGQTALTQGASALTGPSRGHYVRAVSKLIAAATACTAAVLIFAPSAVARVSGLTLVNPSTLRWLALALICSSVFVFSSALLNALGASRPLALLQLAGPGAMFALAWPAARHSAFGMLLALAAAITAVAGVCGLYSHRTTLTSCFRGHGGTLPAARHFFSISGAMLLTSLAGSATLLTVRANIVRHQGLSGAGQFDAAWNISMNQVSLVLASLQTHYLPALTRSTAREACAKIARVLTLAAPASALIIAAIALSKPFWLALFYSAQFHPAVQYLRWTLLGDYLKVTGWILSIPMLACADMRAFLLADLTASAVFLFAALFLARWFTPAEAASIAFLLMHLAHLAIGAIYVRLRYGFLWRPAARSWLAGLSTILAVSIWKWNA